MHVLIDHLAATVVGGIVLLMLFFVLTRLGTTETDQQVYETSQRAAQALTQQLEGDLLNVGYGLPPGPAAVVSWTDSTFTFRRRDGEAPTDPVVTVEYRRVTIGAATVDGVRVPLFDVERYQDGARDGGSSAMLSAFDLDLLDASGASTTDVTQTRALRVRFVASFGTDDDFRTNASRFSRTFHPPNLNG